MRSLSKVLPLFFCMFVVATVLKAEPHTKTFKTDTQWTGVQMEVSEVKRISKDRVVVLVRIEATSKAPETTLIGLASSPAKGGKESSPSQPFSLAAGTLTDEQTKKTYPVAEPDPQAIAYAPTQIMTQLSKGQAVVLSVEFQLPVPAEKDGEDPKQTVTLKLPNAKSDIEHVIIPPLSP
ncbi:MAG: hypothetical protein WCD79_00070 [Chthoniobacteraceae bacterium]